MKYLIPLILILTIASCKPKTTEQIKQLDELLMELQQVNETVAAVDTTSIFELSRAIKSKLQIIHAKADTLDVSSAAVIAQVYEGRFKIFYLEDNYQNFLNELEISSNQLINLKQDLGNGLLTNESFNVFYEQEKTIIVNLNKKIKEAFTGASAAVNSIDQQSSKIDSLINYIDQTRIID